MSYDRTAPGVMGHHADHMFADLGYGPRQKETFCEEETLFFDKPLHDIDGSPLTRRIRIDLVGDGAVMAFVLTEDGGTMDGLTWPEIKAAARLIKEMEAES